MNNTTAQLETISRYFDLGTVEAIEALGGAANANYSLQTSKGDFVVKLVKEHGAASLETLDPFFRALQRQDFPSAGYLTAATGSFIFDQGDTLAVAMRKKPGLAPEINARTVFIMGRTLARLHSIPTTGLAPRSSWFDARFLPRALGQLADTADSEIVSRLRNAMRELEPGDHCGLHQSIVHGDYHAWNLLFDNGRLCAVLDWEEATLGASVLDIAYTTLIEFFHGSNFDADLFSGFIDGYQSLRPLSRSEYQSLPGMLRFAGLTVSAWIWLRFGTSEIDGEIDRELKDLANRYWAADLRAWVPPEFDPSA